MAFSAESISAIKTVAAAEQIDPAALLAVVEVESAGTPFATVDGRQVPLILYEYHVFYRYPGLTAAQRTQAVNQKLAARAWRDLPYARSQAARYSQLARAAKINPEAAHAACSWGVGQVLGENAGWLGYASPTGLAQAAMRGLDGQVEVMLRFIAKAGLRDELIRRDWAGFARGYNGKGAVAVYSAKLAAACRRHASALGARADEAESAPCALSMGMTGEPVARLQRLLRGLGFGLEVDGDFGPATRRQVVQFQTEQGLEADGVAGPITMGRLESLTHQHGEG